MMPMLQQPLAPTVVSSQMGIKVKKDWRLMVYQ